MDQDNLTAKQLDYAIFLPAISGFYATFVGKQRNEPYVDPARFPAGLTDMEQMNWLNSTKALFPYKWSLYSGGHANLDLNKQDWSEDMVRNREAGTTILGDSGGFQIAKGLWEGDWKANSGCARAQAKRGAILNWLDNIADYGMGLDIPTWVVRDPFASSKCQISTHQEAVDATRFNNEYFIRNRRGVQNGGAKFLNVLQGANHSEAEDWYQTMKHYCDPVQYPDKPVNSFEITRESGKVEIKGDPEITKTLDTPNMHRADLFLGYFTNINCEGYLNGLPDNDSTIRQAPKQSSIDITGMHGQHQHVDIYWMALNKRSKNVTTSDPDVPDDYDADRLYAVVNNYKDTVMIQRFVFGRIFRKCFEFFQYEAPHPANK